ncbi:polymorphic toxin-type HINT domain-containing protein, partial [Leptospira harrisiae]|uniref:polymorphic toxin-type HINT domain-containing protein n=1 Tax=Leptospira harrisiae TaxID=2023189 RepID=UPI00244B0342
VKLAGFSAGVSYTQNGGFGANVGYEFGGSNDMLKGLGVNLSYSQSGGFSGGVSYSKATEGGTKVTGGLNYSKDAGVGASLNAQKEVSKSDNYATTVTGGVSFSQKQGFGASLDATIEKVAKETPKGQTPPPKPQFQSFSQMDMGLSFNQKEGFSASVGFDGINALSYNQNTGLSGNTNFAVDFRKKQIQDEIDAETKARKEAADKKLEGAKQEWLKEKRKDPKYANIDDDDKLLAEYKKEREKDSEKDGSRDNILEKIGGDIYDDVAGALGISTSDAGRLDKDGKFVPRTCFVAGTKVHTKEGLKNIEDIQVGDVVLSKSDETGEVSYRKVVETFIRQTEAIYTVSFTDGTTLETTWNHPFRVKTQGHALEKFSIETTDWVQAKDLHPGDVALGADGRELVVTDIIIDERTETVYNFEVEEYHTYFVGEVGVWVHNQASTYQKISKGLHYSLDIAGIFPGLGIIPDAVNVAYNATEATLGIGTGNWTDAGFSTAAILPIAGDFAMAGKVGKEATEAAIKNKKAIADLGKEGIENFKYAQEYGIKSYKELKNVTKGKAKELGVEVHHLIEKRLKPVFDEASQKTSEWASIVLTKAEHQVFTNEWRKAIPYGAARTKETAESVMEKAKVIYKDYPQILEKLGINK